MTCLPLAVRPLLAALSLLTALALPAVALAGDPPQQEVTLGKDVKLSFHPGFGLGCPHFACVFIDDDSVIQPVGATFSVGEPDYYEFKPSKKTKFPFKPLKAGTTEVTVQFKGTSSCPGTAFVTLEVTVTPDLKLLVKQVKTETKLAIKLIKQKIKDGLNWFCDELEFIEDDYYDGEISACQAQWELERLSGHTLFGLGLQLQACLSEYSAATAEPLIAAAIDELLEELQRGSCASLYDQVLEAGTDSYTKFADTLDKKIDQVLKGIMKDEEDYAFANLVVRAAPPLALARLSSLSGTSPEVSRVPASLTMASGLRKAAGRSLFLSGIGDLDVGELLARVTDSAGNSAEYMAPLSSLPTVGSLFNNYPFGGDDGRQGEFQILITPTLVVDEGDLVVGASDPGAEPDIDAGGPFLIELLYPGDAHPTYATMVSVP